jgi:hypothetical protein
MDESADRFSWLTALTRHGGERMKRLLAAVAGIALAMVLLPAPAGARAVPTLSVSGEAFCNLATGQFGVPSGATSVSLSVGWTSRTGTPRGAAR